MCGPQERLDPFVMQDELKPLAPHLCPPPIPQAAGSKLMGSADGSSDSQLPFYATSSASGSNPVIKPQPRHLFRMHSLQEPPEKSRFPLFRMSSSTLPDRGLTIAIGGEKEVRGGASLSVSPSAMPRKQLLPYDDCLTPRKRIRKKSFPRRSSMGDDHGAEHVVSHEEWHAAELLRALDLSRGSLQGAGSGESDNTVKMQAFLDKSAVQTWHPMSPPALPEQECDSLFPLRCHVPRKFRSGGAPDDVMVDAYQPQNGDKATFGGEDAWSPSGSGREHGGDGLLGCADCGRYFQTLKALSKCNACYQSHWRTMKRQRQRQTADGYTPSPPSSPCSSPRSQSVFRRDSIPSSYTEEPNSPLVPPPVPANWGQSVSLFKPPAKSLFKGPVECEEGVLSVGVDRQTDWVVSLQNLLSSYQSERDPSKLYELRDKINAQLPAEGTPTQQRTHHHAHRPHHRQSADAQQVDHAWASRVNDQQYAAGPSKVPHQRKSTAPRKDWHQYPGVCTPMKKPCPPKRVRQLEALLNEGLISAGEAVFYRSKQGECLAQGVIRGAGIECMRCGRVVACTEFEQCAGSAMRKPCQHIIARGSGQSLQQLMQQLPQKDS